MSRPEFTINFDEMYGPLYQCPAVNCYEVMRTKDKEPKCPNCGAFMEPIRPFKKDKTMKKMSMVLVCFLGLASYSQAGILFNRGCHGGQASSGCQGSQGGCQGFVAQGCTSSQASCYGGHGSGRRFHVFPLFHRRSYSVPSAPVAPPQALPMPKKLTAEASTTHLAVYGVEAKDALSEVNAARAKRGLRAFQRDEGLMAGALACAKYRAEHRMAGHTHNDFAYLPPGVTAKVGGCSGLEPEWGFQSCAMYESWTYAGAASVPGGDGRVYHQLFCR